MTKSRQIAAILVVLAIAVFWMTYGSGDFAGAEQAGGDVNGHLEQAATSVIAAAKESIQSASSDDEAALRMEAAVKALQMIGMVGDVDTGAQTEKLLDDLQSVAKPAVVEQIIQLRLAQQLQQWSHLDDAERDSTIYRLVADVQQVGLTRELADVFMRLVDRLEMTQEYELASRAVNKLLPAFQKSDEPQIQRRAPLLEGVVRRLPGNKLELEGTLLEGGTLDWESFRGKVVLVDFFASWCIPCRAEVPNVLANYRAYKDKGFEVVGVSMDDERLAAETYVRQAGFDFPTLFSEDPNATGWDHPMGRKYGVMALPRVILVDKDGTIVSTMARGPQLEKLLLEMLGAPTPSDEQSTDNTEVDPNVAPASFEDDAAPADVPEE